MKLSTAVLALAGFLAVALPGCKAAYCHGSPHDGHDNNLPIWDSAPKKVKTYFNTTSSARAELYTANEGDDQIHVLHLWGKPYDLGYAQGSIVPEMVVQKVTMMWDHMLEEMEQTLPTLPKWLQDLIATLGADAALEATWLLVRPWVGEYWVQELRGLCDASGASWTKARNMHLLASLTQGKCSMYGATGSAVRHVEPTTGLMQLRALDWDTSAAARYGPMAVVYHPNANNGYPFINIGWAGWIGSITGLSSNQIGISEIGVTYPNGFFGTESREGYPFAMMLRDIIQFDKTEAEALHRVGTANRTCDLLFGVGDGKGPVFRGMAVSSEIFRVFNSSNLLPLLNGTHPRIQDIVYWGMDWACPHYDKPFSELLMAHHGNISAHNTIRKILPNLRSGDTHAAIYDLTNMNFWMAAARQPHVTEGALEAYWRSYTKLDAKSLFATPAPTHA